MKGDTMRAGVIGAMDEEISMLRDRLTSANIIDIADFSFYSGQLEGVDVILLKGGIGKVNAAIGSTLINILFNPNCIINTGSAGALCTELEIGDVIISNEVRHHDVDVTAFGYEYGQVPAMPSSYLPSNALIKMALQSSTNMPEIRVKSGLIATGDSFMCDPEKINQIRKKMPMIQVVEMEAAAIAQTCHQFGKNFLIIRSVSDVAGRTSPTTFEMFLEKAAQNSIKIVLGIIKELKQYEKENERRSKESIQRRKKESLKYEKYIQLRYRSQAA
jgi:adenosylhomocysteine nucleosidase